MDLSYLIEVIYNAISEEADINLGIRVYGGDIYLGTLLRTFLIDPVCLGPAPDNFLDILHDTLTSEFKDVITPMTVHTTGMDYTYYLTINDVFIQFPKDDTNWIIQRMHKNEETTLGSR